MENSLSIDNLMTPQILAAEKDFLVFYKPPKMHSAPQRASLGKNALEWCAEKYPEIADLPGRKAGEGGLLHRLDYETHGLLLFARSALGVESLTAQQGAEKIVKEYSALCSQKDKLPAGFPPKFPSASVWPLQIRSAFRPFGPGQKVVRPLSFSPHKNDQHREYLTEILDGKPLKTGLTLFRVALRRGFRHQIRCHLAWIASPIINDGLYGSSGEGLLGLRACAISFTDPSTGRERFYTIPPLKAEDPGFAILP